MSCVEFAFLSRSCLNVAILLAVCTEDCRLSCMGFSASSVYHVPTVHENKHWISLNSNTGVCVRQGEQTSHYSPFVLPFSYLPFSLSFLSLFKISSYFVAQAHPKFLGSSYLWLCKSWDGVAQHDACLSKLL